MATKKAALLGAQDGAGAAAAAPAGTALANRPAGASNALALPADLAAELAGYAKADSAVERPKISKISFKSGMMSYMQQQVPNDSMDVILLSTAFRNTFYGGAYDPDNIVNPTCFAIKASRDGEAEMMPHPNVAEPIHPSCAGCPKNEWGSAIRDGKPSRGKACKEGRRVLVIPAGVLDADDPVQAIKAAEKAVFDVPVTSVANYGNFVNTLAATMNRPMWSVVTNLKLVRDMRTQFKLVFTPMRPINDSDLIRALQSMLEDAERTVTIPYDESYLAGEEKAAPAPSTVKASKFTKK